MAIFQHIECGIGGPNNQSRLGMISSLYRLGVYSIKRVTYLDSLASKLSSILVLR